MEEDGRQDQKDQAYENITGKPWHNCTQEERIKRLEERQDETIKNIDNKLEKIWKAINAGDNENTKNIIQVVGYFLAALCVIFVSFLAFLKFA